jgi:hypothetical protein
VITGKAYSIESDICSVLARQELLASDDSPIKEPNGFVGDLQGERKHIIILRILAVDWWTIMLNLGFVKW